MNLHQRIDELQLTAVETAAVKWQYNLYGSFYTSLFNAIMLADELNLERLAKAFPTEVEAYKRYSREENWWVELQDKFLNS